MLKRQKEVVLYQLGEEEKVIKQLERQYRKALEDVEMVIRILMTDEQTPSKINRINYQKRLQTQLEGVLEALHTNQYKTINAFLQDSYTDSFVGAVYDMHGQRVPLILPVDQNAAVKAIQLDTKLSERKIHPNMNGEHVTLYESLGVDIDHLKKAIRQEITRGIATGMEIKDIARNISLRTKAPLSRAKTIARTESHRIQESSKQDARTAAREKGADVVKKWDSTMDGDTRPDHRALDGQIREVDEPFEIHGKRAMNPGGFGKPGDDCNCRCLGLTIARWLLGEEDLERMQEKAKYWDLDKTQGFEDFKKKYLKAAEETAKHPPVPTPRTLTNLAETLEWAEEDRKDKFEFYRGLPEEYHEPFDAFEAEIPKYEQQLAKAFEKFDFATNTDGNAVEQILRDGRLKGTVETHTSNGELDVDLRKRATEGLFGLYDEIEGLEADEFEKYGYLGTADRAKMYGDCRIVFNKEALWDRTTFTVGDSLEAFVNGGYKSPSKVSDPKIVSFSKDPFSADHPSLNEVAMRNIRKAFDSIEEHGYFKGVINNEDYVELQFHGAVLVEDIAYIEIPQDCANLAEILEVAEEKGVKIKVKKRKQQ